MRLDLVLTSLARTKKSAPVEIERSLIQKLTDLKYTYRPDIRDREALEKNFRKKFD